MKVVFIFNDSLHIIRYVWYIIWSDKQGRITTYCLGGENKNYKFNKTQERKEKMKQKMRKRGRILSMILTAIILITSLSSNLVYATEADGNSSVQTRTLTISAGEGGSVEVKDFPEQESYQFAPGEKVNLIVSEDPGYIFLELKSEEDVNMDTISDSEITFIMPDQDIEITPIFEKQDQDSNLSETDPVVEDNQKETRFNLAHEMGLDAWVDDDGYLLEDYYEDKTDLELSQLGVAPLVKAIDLNNGIMPLTVTKYEKVTYGNNIVGYFEVDGHPAMCCEHDLSTPSVGYATGSPELITDNRLRIVMYYGYTGPGNIFSDYNKGCVATSLALSYYVDYLRLECQELIPREQSIVECLI